MKNPIVIFLMAVHLLAHTDVVQLCKIPNLFEHYRLHHQQNQHIDFFAFLSMHYGVQPKQSAADDWEDQQLPFKKADFHLVCYVVAMPQQQETLLPVPLPKERIYSDYQTVHFPVGQPVEQFRPPIAA
jgi:hypothetical protein